MRGKLVLWLAGVLSLVLLGTGCKSKMVRAGSAYSESVGAVAGSAFAAGEAGKPAARPPVETTGELPAANADERLMTYDATLTVVVQDISGTLDALKALANRLKGYMQEMSESSIIVRIPAAQLNEALRQVEALGEVTAREIKGNDVTEEMRDLDIRLKNMQEMRDRLVKLLDRGDKVEDLLKVEKELERVTEALELLKGRIQYLSHAVAYSTLTVRLNSPVPQKELQDVIPFAWVRNLAADIVLQPGSSFVPEKRFWPWLKFELPPAFVKLYDGDGCTRAMSGTGVMLLIQRERNFEGGTADFWAPIVRRWLAGGRVIALAESKELALESGARGFALTGTKTLGRKTYQYLLSVIPSRDYVYTFECWGPADEVAKEREAVDKACRSMKIKP